ncbi:MAG: lipoprotein [Gammaproteobacteria bacterium]|nr:lipoprotein [Gammaproteobacteria bacterium]MDH5628724.1 lipoprotein [Gammaproteobacteria bacterium]
MKKFKSLILLSAVLLFSCGQKGDLIIEDDPHIKTMKDNKSDNTNSDIPLSIDTPTNKTISLKGKSAQKGEQL